MTPTQDSGITVSNIFLHIGFPKTATTTLQTILEAHDGCFYLGKGLREKAAPNLSLRIAHAALYLDHFRFEAALPGLRREIACLASKAPALVVSDETFAFAEYMYLGAHWPNRPLPDHEMAAVRLAQILPGARVLMSLREQLDFLKSFYRQKIKRDEETRSLSEFIQAALQEADGRSMMHAIRYDEAFSAYARHFGPEHVHVSIYETYRKDFALYLDEVATIIGLDRERLRAEWNGLHANTDRPRRERKSVQRVRKYLPKVMTSRLPHDWKSSILDRLARPAPSMELDGDIAAAVNRYYAEPNRALSSWTGLNLAAHGYAVAEGAAKQV